MKCGSRRSALLLSSALAGLVVLSFGGAAYAADQTYQFDIPAEPLGQALTDFSRASSQQIVFSEDLTAGKSTKGLHGRYTASDALDGLLAGTGLRVETNSSGVMMVRSKNVQAAPNEAAAPAGIETIVVTGTNIRGAINNTVPMDTISRNDILKSGYSTTQELFASLPQNFNGGSSGASETGILGTGLRKSLNLSDATGVNLRGLGTDSTLVLLDGHRIASAIQGTAVDISLIPLTAIDHVDVVSDGASAIYGADAVAGVVNIVLRKDISGAETDLSGGTVTSGSRHEGTVSQLFGDDWSGGNALVMAQFQHADSLPTYQRGFTNTAPTPADILPRTNTASIIATASQSFGADLDASIEGTFAHKTADRDITTTGVASASWSSDDTTNALNLIGTVNYRPFGDWQFETTGSYSREDDQLVDVYRFGTPVGGVSGAPCCKNSYESWGVQELGSGSLFSLPGGRARVAIGASYQGEGAQYRVPAQNSRKVFARDVEAVFGEIYLPIIGPENNIPFVRRLEFSAATRYDNYSDFGGTTNPRVGIFWSPSEELEFRGSYSTSFRAPTASEVFGEASGATLFNFRFAAPAGGTVPVFVLSGSPSVLEPERSRNFTAGVDYTPKFLDQLKLGVNYFNIDFSDQIAQPPFSVSALLLPSIYGSLITPVADDAAAQAYLNAELSQGAHFIDSLKTGATGIRYLFSDQVRNISKTAQDGFDFRASYVMSFGAGELTASLNGTILDTMQTQLASGSTPASILNTLGNPIKYRVRGGVSWSDPTWQLSMFSNFEGRYRDTTTAPVSGIGSVTTVDFNARYSPDIVPGLSLGFGVLNLFDTSPPHTGALQPGIFYDVANGDPLGRFVSLQIQKSW